MSFNSHHHAFKNNVFSFIGSKTEVQNALAVDFSSVAEPTSSAGWTVQMVEEMLARRKYIQRAIEWF
jgi:hypothetical protein